MHCNFQSTWEVDCDEGGVGKSGMGVLIRCLLWKSCETVGDVDQDGRNNTEDKREYREIVVRENGQGPGSSCRQKVRSMEKSRVLGMVGSHTAI